MQETMSQTKVKNDYEEVEYFAEDEATEIDVVSAYNLKTDFS